MWQNMYIRRGKSCENPTSFGTVRPKLWNVGNFASEDGKSCEKTKGFLGSRAKNVEKI